MEEEAAQREDESARAQESSTPGGDTHGGRGRDGEQYGDTQHHQQYQQQHILPHSYPAYGYQQAWTHQDHASSSHNYYEQSVPAGSEGQAGEQEGGIQQHQQEGYQQYYDQGYYYMMQLWMAHQGYQPLVDQSG